MTLLANSVTVVRERIKDKLEQDFGSINWYMGRLNDNVVNRNSTIGAISSIQEVQAVTNDWVNWTVAVQVFLPVTTIDPENWTPAVIRDPKAIEELVRDIRNTISELDDGANHGYASMLFRRVDYPNDPNGQQTRAEMFFEANAMNVWGT